MPETSRLTIQDARKIVTRPAPWWSLLILVGWWVAVRGLAPTPPLLPAAPPVPLLVPLPLSAATGTTPADHTGRMRLMRQAKAAGVDGFVVHWQPTPQGDDPWLAQVINAAEAEALALVVTYEDTDPAALEHFAQEYGERGPFDLFERPVVIWPALARLPRAEVTRVTAPLRQRLLILTTEDDTTRYRDVAGAVDGAAPQPDAASAADLARLGAIVHASGGLWLAPVVPAGGVHDPEQGDALRLGLDAASGSSPDALRLTRWSLSGDTPVSVERVLTTLGDVEAARVPSLPDFDSDAPAQTRPGSLDGARLAAFVLLGGLLVISVGAILRQSR